MPVFRNLYTPFLALWWNSGLRWSFGWTGILWRDRLPTKLLQVQQFSMCFQGKLEPQFFRLHHGSTLNYKTFTFLTFCAFSNISLLHYPRKNIEHVKCRLLNIPVIIERFLVALALAKICLPFHSFNICKNVIFRHISVMVKTIVATTLMKAPSMHVDGRLSDVRRVNGNVLEWQNNVYH